MITVLLQTLQNFTVIQSVLFTGGNFVCGYEVIYHLKIDSETAFACLAFSRSCCAASSYY